jgi:hypothetical protein
MAALTAAFSMPEKIKGNNRKSIFRIEISHMLISSAMVSMTMHQSNDRFSLFFLVSILR